MASLKSTKQDLAWYTYGDSSEMHQSNEDDFDMDMSQDCDDYSQSLASSSSIALLSTASSKVCASSNSSVCEVGDRSSPEHAPRSRKHQDRSGIVQSTSPMPSYQYGTVHDCVDPKLVTSKPMLTHNWGVADDGAWTGTGQASRDRATVDKGCKDTSTPSLQTTYQTSGSDFDVAFNDLQVTTPGLEMGAQMWLHTWVATNPDRFPDIVELESLKILSGLSDAEIMTWLSQQISLQLDSALQPVLSRQEETPRPTRAPRYRPKCRRSRRRFRYIAEVPDETRIYECTHRCGQSFAKKGQWTRHERYNVEEWQCHLCKFVSARKDKLLKHLRDSHNMRGSTKKSHCRQLLESSLRPCGFCLKQFDDWSIWLNHVSAHFEGQIAGGPWTMAMWTETLDMPLGLGVSDDDDNDDDDDDDNGNDEDQTDYDCDSSAADQAGRLPDRGTRSSGHGSQGSSTSSGSSRSVSSGHGASKPRQTAARESVRHDQGSSMAESVSPSVMLTGTHFGAVSMPVDAMSATYPTASGSATSSEQTLEVWSPDFSGTVFGVTTRLRLTPRHQLTDDSSKGDTFQLDPQPPTQPLKSRTSIGKYDARVLRSHPSSMRVAAEKVGDNLRYPVGHAAAVREEGFLKTQLSTLDSAEGPCQRYFSDVNGRSFHEPVLPAGSPASTSLTSFGYTPLGRAAIRCGESGRGRPMIHSEREIVPTTRQQGSCGFYPCLPGICCANNKHWTTKDCQESPNSFNNDPGQGSFDQTPRSNQKLTALDFVNDGHYSVPNVRSDVHAEPMNSNGILRLFQSGEHDPAIQAPAKSSLVSRPDAWLGLVGGLVAVMGVTGAGKSAFISTLCHNNSGELGIGCHMNRKNSLLINTHNQDVSTVKTVAVSRPEYAAVKPFTACSNIRVDPVESNDDVKRYARKKPSSRSLRIKSNPELVADIGSGFSFPSDEIFIRIPLADLNHGFSSAVKQDFISLLQRYPLFSSTNYDPSLAKSDSILSAIARAGQSLAVRFRLENEASRIENEPDDDNGLFFSSGRSTVAPAGYFEACGSLLHRTSSPSIGLLDVIYGNQGNQRGRVAGREEYDERRSNAMEQAGLGCDASACTRTLATHKSSTMPTYDFICIVQGQRVLRSRPNRKGDQVPQPRRANFETIRRLYGAKDRAHLTRFKLDRYLNDHEGGCYPPGFFLKRSIESGGIGSVSEMIDDRYTHRWMKPSRPPVDNHFYWEADFASAPGIAGQ